MNIRLAFGISLLGNLILVGLLFGIGQGVASNTRSPEPLQIKTAQELLEASIKTPPTVDAEELRCLARTIYFEARGEPMIGQIAVARVVMARVKSDDYPDTVCRVATQGKYRSWKSMTREEIAAQPKVYAPSGPSCQFSWYCDGKPHQIRLDEQWSTALRLAYDVLAYDAWGEIFGDVTHFHNTSVSPSWAAGFRKVVRISNHVFYKNPS